MQAAQVKACNINTAEKTASLRAEADCQSAAGYPPAYQLKADFFFQGRGSSLANRNKRWSTYAGKAPAGL
jgi:hypothetical protein